MWGALTWGAAAATAQALWPAAQVHSSSNFVLEGVESRN